MGKKVICFGEVLWDDFGETKTIGGAPLNVCYHLSKLNIDPVMVSMVGKDPLGAALLEQIAAWQIDAQYCTVSEKYPTSTVKVHLQKGGDVQYTITEGVAWDFLSYDAALAADIARADAFVYGTLAARNAETRKVLLEYVKRSKWPVLDLNLRQPYCNETVILPIIKTCRSIKLNQEELNFVCQLCNGEVETEQKAIALVFARFGNIEEIILTKGGAGASYYNRNEHIEIKGVPVKVRDTVGSGDSFLAAFIHGRLSGWNHRETLEEAIVLSAFMATQNGGCPPYTLTDIENFKKSIV